MIRDERLTAAYDECRRINKRHGTSYFFATRFFDRERRDATHALYAFFRVPDDMVDHAGADGGAAALRDWQERWTEAVRSGNSDHPVLLAAADVFRRYRIPAAYADAFLTAMHADLTIARYADYEALRGYMYGSAAVVGLMMTRVIGSVGPEADPYAEKLGYAMQLTNFIRDVGEDLRERGRVYLPQEDLDAHGVTVADLERGTVTPQVRALLAFQAERARRLYRQAEPGIELLHPRGRYAVRLASRLYEAILDEVERNGYDVFNRRARTSLTRKIGLALAALIPSHGERK